QPASALDPRRRGGVELDEVALARRRPEQGDRLRHPLRRHGPAAPARRLHRLHASAPGLMDDRTLLDSRETLTAGQLERIHKEFSEGFELLSRIDRPAVSIFGSARIGETDPVYAEARAVAREFALRGWAVITGGGPGVMEAANRG